jgi:hypothetical protein
VTQAGDDHSAGAAQLESVAASGIDLAARTTRDESSDWDLEQEVRRVQARAGMSRRIDPAGIADPHGVASARRAELPRRRADRAHDTHRPHYQGRGGGPKHLSTSGWMLLTIGLMAFACGTTLLIWSWLESRDDLWKLGLPITIGGQASLLIGLVLHLERIWQNSRLAVVKLAAVDEQLRRLERESAAANLTHGTAQAFYHHMATSASPEILLADLKGQLDLLSHEVSRRR